ncbi:MAG: AraC family transcriptional regulator, partial [Proteobacteria bacterium]|nr:AraC family transcriptional regulator [Pseudomonadota bacterium]
MEGQHRVGILTGVPGLLRELGVAPDPVIAGARIDPALLADTESSVSFVRAGALLNACAEATGRPEFGLLLGQRSGLAHFGLVGRLMRSAPSMREALLDFTTNQHRYTRGAAVFLSVHDGTAFYGYAMHVPGVEGLEVINDAAISVGFNMVRELGGFAPEGVHLSRRKPADPAPYRRFYGFLPRFDAEQNAVTFPAARLATPVRTADAAARAELLRTVADYWTVAQPSLADRVVRTLRGRAAFPGVSLEDVAERLAMHPRTLNRRLRADGTNFRELLNTARLELAQQWLQATQMSITDIALALGYSDLSSFSRAFQRATGTPPSAWRQQTDAPPPGATRGGRLQSVSTLL